MQFSVPQFTDVEDKIIGPFTIKQFGIVFGAGTIVFIIYSLTKSLLGLIVGIVLIGIPGLILAFGKFNGRPMYSNVGKLISFFTQPRRLLFHKEGIDPATNMLDMTLEVKDRAPRTDGASNIRRLKELNYQLQKQVQRETELSHQIKK